MQYINLRRRKCEYREPNECKECVNIDKHLGAGGCTVKPCCESIMTPQCTTHIENSKCTVIVGTKDSVISKEEIFRIGTNHLVDLHVIDGAVHSLEIEDDCHKSLDILMKINNLYEKFVSNN